MALDGSFTCQGAMLRFLSRYPKLRSNPRFSSLLQKELHISTEDVVAVVADLFLHPSYTIPLVGCFRPLIRQIFQRVLDKLYNVGNFEFDLEPGEDGEEIGEEDMHVIDFYVRRGKKLKLHELACLAFSRAVDLAPFLLSALLSYFEFAPPPFRRLLLAETKMRFTEKVDFCIIKAIRVSYRLLLLEPKEFSILWDMSKFLDLEQYIYSPRFETADPVFIYLLDIRWCVIQIWSVVFQISDRVISDFGMKAEEAFMCLLRWEEFCQDTSLEKAGWYLKEAEVKTETQIIEPGNLYQHIKSFENFSYSLDNVSQRNHKNKISCGQQLLDSKFFLTSTLKKRFELVLMAVSQKWPVLLYGPSGSGKTAMINDLALKSGSRVLFIHMDEQMDSKSLIGSYISSEQPGEFKWQPGSLTQALLYGFWVVFEDIDKAPNEMQSIILPLLEGSSSFDTGHGEVIAVSERFCLFGTVSTSRHEFLHKAEGIVSFSDFWRKVMVPAPSRDDMIDLIDARYPILCFLSSQLVDTFERVNSLVSYRFSQRDLLKWCKRIALLPLNLSGLGLSSFDSENIFKEAVDVFAAFLSMSESRSFLNKEIANLWGVTSQGAMLYSLSKPTLQMQQSYLQIGRIRLHCIKRTVIQEKHPFVSIRNALHSLERIACSIKCNEPVLLVGETGTGKTTLVQNLAMRLGAPLIVMNLSQQTDVADLLGGYKPTDAQSICMPLYYEFEELFCDNFSKKDNESLFRRLDNYVLEKKWKRLLHAFKKLVPMILKLVGKTNESDLSCKRKRPLSERTAHMWESYSLRLDCALKQLNLSSLMSFKFVEGAFVTALKSGQWLLLDEVNLAPPETLQRIIGALDEDQGTLCLSERGDINNVERHPDFRLFACMNPATDAGKKELPIAFKSRFTEYFIDDVLDDDDLMLFVNQYMGEGIITAELTRKIVQFYKIAKNESEEKLQDSANQKPQFSLRSLARALTYTRIAGKSFGLKKALYDGFYMFFVSLLDAPSSAIMHNLILSYLLNGKMPNDIPLYNYFSGNSTTFDDSMINSFTKNYVLTRSVKAHLKNLARAFYIKRYPVLLQGPTSSGKTSLVQYLASVTRHEFVRINNHEHTDLQEYFGFYTTDSHGRLHFQEGILVKAVRNGYWIVLDELNLAPSDVLEALNRLLDDNRELFIPERQETIRAHPNFMLFATQNPPTVYGGRKILSRAFRNRFLEIHVDEIPDDELATILEKRCCIPASYASRMVEVMKDLQLRRQNSKVFAGKHGYITPRDLFRWANRFRNFGKSYDDLAKDGYFLLAERLREENEKNVVREVLEHHLNVKLVIDELYKVGHGDVGAALKSAEQTRDIGDLSSITWTQSMWRLYFLVERCYKMREPVLLVGDTGGGKTTVCQLLSIVLGSRLHILNCHQYTETSDFIGGFHPVRERTKLVLEFRDFIVKMKESHFFVQLSENYELSSDISEASSTLCYLDKLQSTYKQSPSFYPTITEDEFILFEAIKSGLLELHQKWQTIFLWQDGPLVQAMRNGDLFLVDEISLADDSVLERLNSVLEPERTVLLAEKGGSTPEEIIAHPNFLILATMNPGGDYGKKELSPALRNRFTEIWVPSVCDVDELKCIALERLFKPDLTFLVDCMLKFWQLFNKWRTGRVLTVRDLLSWISFINMTEENLGSQQAFLHGAFLVLLDGLSLGTNMLNSEVQMLQRASLDFLILELKASGLGFNISQCEMQNYGWDDFVDHTNVSLENYASSKNCFGIYPFFINKGQNDCKPEEFEFRAPTTRKNVLRVLRAMQLPRPVLLEGSPGVGKTSLVVALAQHSGHTVVRINLSEQTDMMDLLGSDFPVEGERGMEFSWVDGILLQALKNGYWILLDELNLAPQSVLEGLNAILDHRSEVYIPELGLSFKCPASFRVFACQNPSSQGGGRKGLPKSFLNRFIKVHVDDLTADDYLFICQSRFSSIPSGILSKLITFNSRIYDDTMIKRKYGQDGFPWEFNLRDVMRSCEILQGVSRNTIDENFLNIVYLQRMRSAADRREVIKLYADVFGLNPSIPWPPNLYINPQYLVVGRACVERNHYQPTKVFKSQLNLLPGLFGKLEAVAHCVQRRWLCILVGPSSSGKTSLLRLLAELTGNILHELNLSSGTDVSELLGCFEHYESFRNYKAVTSQIKHYVDEYFCLGLKINWNDFIHKRKHLFSKWFSFFSSHISSRPTSSFATSSIGESSSSLDPLVEIINQLQHDLNKFSLPLSYSCTDLNKCLKTIQVLQKNWLMQPSAKFEWVPGNLINAIEHGEWVVLDNANLCNPTVLDRINSLVEPNGSITINECGLVDGKPLLLNAHSRFRMFITIDPKYGEVSRAMRNRGVEICMLQPESVPVETTFTFENIEGWPVEETSTSEDIEIDSVKRFLTLSGIPLDKMVLAMSKAHFSARKLGLCLGVRITFLELARWVQLFQQLIMNGNDPVWSLQLSWEHTYLAALGEMGGRVIMQGKISYLSDPVVYKLNPHLGYSLSFPGGWPLPHALRNFVNYSKESCVKQNCMYLEFLSRNVNPSSLTDNKIYQDLLLNSQKNYKQVVLDLAQPNQMLFFAANWTIEQANENDLDMYIGWLKWQHLKLQQSCGFLESFFKIFEQEMKHPIWKCIRDCRKKLLDHLGINLDIQPIPLLSPNLVNFSTSDSCLWKINTCLINAIRCASMLRRTFHQWNTEILLPSEDIFGCAMKPILKSLRKLEDKLLGQIVDFSELFDDYSYLLELHILFWENVKSFHVEHLSIIWSWLKKTVIKFQLSFPEAVDTFLVEGQNHEFVPGWKFNTGTPTLWAHGGRPFVPSSADIFYKLKNLTGFCSNIWHTSWLSKEIQSDEKFQLEVIISSNADLKRLALKGVCEAKYIATNHVKCLNRLEMAYQNILSRFEDERKCLESTSKSTQNLKAPSTLLSKSVCCDFSSEMLCRKSCFDSWLAVLPLFNRRSLSLDINLIFNLSKSTLVDALKSYKDLPTFAGLLQQTLDYSLNNSSRSPIDFCPHQTFLKMFDDGISIDSVYQKFSSLILEMWFGWHSSLWNCFSSRVESSPWIKESFYDLFPTRTQILGIILQGCFTIKDYEVNCMKLRVTSRALCQDAPLHGSLMEVLLSSASCLFMQILFVHEKYFKEDEFARLKLLLIKLMKGDAKNEDLHGLKLIFSSNLSLFSSLKESVIQPLLEEIYNARSSNDPISLGQAWAHIGILRFHLLLNPDGPDPIVKSGLKNSWILRRKSLLELEMEVHRECELQSGKSNNIMDKRFKISQEKLEIEEKRVQGKIIFRPEPSKYNKLKLACSDFLELALSWTSSLKNVRCNTEVAIMIKEMKNQQVTCESFITRLSENFSEYIDLVQPIQVAVYEMKLGISLVISGIVERECMIKINIDKIDKILDPVCLIMQFPKALLVRRSLITFETFTVPKMKACENRGCERGQIHGINQLNSLIAISSEICTLRDISHLQQQSMICHITFLQVAHSICCSLVMDKDSFLLLNEIFRHFSSFWVGMKSKSKASEEDDAQYFKFRPRSIILNDVLVGDVDSFGVLESGGNLSLELQELLMEQEFFKVKEFSKEVDNVEDEWNLIPESIWSRLVDVHNQLFGSENLVNRPGVCFITDQERLLSFLDSYKLGSTLIEGLQTLSSITDDKLLPEHLLRVCLEYESSSCSKTSPLSNVYKDSNAEVMFRMVEPLTIIQNKVKSFLEEWPEHPSIMKVIEITDTLMEIPPCTPLSKALLGLQLLVSKIQFLQENDSRFYLKDEIQLLYPIVSSWQKLEVDSWTTFFDGVSEKHEVNAAKLWFPLYGVLQRSFSGDVEADKMLTIQSVEDFIRTSSVGQFKKRLQLLLAFHGQLKDGVYLKVYDSHAEELLKTLYNFFGYYVQFLPRVLKHIEAGKGSIEKDLKECLKLFSWEHPCTQTSFENFRRARQKVRKLTEKFNDFLQEPVMVVITEESKLKSEEDPAYLRKSMSNKEELFELQFPIDLARLGSAERFLCFGDWKRKANAAFQNFNNASNRANIPFVNLDKSFKMAWDYGWNAIDRICRNAASFSHIWKHETRNLMKRRALSELLKVLEKGGLSRHRPVDFQELESGQPCSSFLQPSFEVLHLLPQESSSSSVDATIGLPFKSEEHANIRCFQIWAIANKFYFKSLSMIHRLHESQTCFSKDLSLELVNQVISYIDHLIVVQRDQRSVAYCFSGRLKKLRQLCHSLGNIGTHCSYSPHQLLVREHMQKQKDLFDNLLAMLKDMKIFLVVVKKSHMDACNVFRDDADHLSVIVDEFIPLFIESKNELDRHLLGRNRVISASNTYMPFIVTIQMEELIRSNFVIITKLEEAIKAPSIQKGCSVSVKDSLLKRLRKMINEGNEEIAAFKSEVVASDNCDDHSFNKRNAEFIEAFERTHKAIVEVFEKIDFSQADHCSDGVLSAEDITLWNKIFESYMKNLHLDQICDGLCKTITAANYLLDCPGIEKFELCSQVGIQLKRLHLLLDLLLEFSEAILFEFIEAHRTIAEMTNVLAQIFTLLLFKGFGTTEDQAEKIAQGTQDSCGTGMGEGEGVNDVSDQIEDEAQLTGTAEKDLADNPDKVPSDKDKGIEMDEDFDADAFSVSEDSEDPIDGDEGDDGEDVDIESKMGETGDRKQVVDEKLCDKENDLKPENSLEKNEFGPSVEEMDTGDRELRGKEEDSTSVEEAEQFDKNEPDGQTEEQKDVSDDENIADDMMLDKNTAFDDPSQIQTTKEENYQEDDGMDETQGSDIAEGGSVPAESDEEMPDDDLSDPAEAVSDENTALAEEKHDTSKNPESTENKSVELEPSNDVTESDKSNSVEYSQDRGDMSKQLPTPFSVESILEPQICWPDNTNMNNSVVPSSISMDECLSLQFSMTNSNDSSKFVPNLPQLSISQVKTQPRHLKVTNPYRSIGQAIENLKENVSILDDPQEEQSANPDYMNEDESFVEYRYVSEGEKNTSQALGPATADQIKNNVDGNKDHETIHGDGKENDTGINQVKEHPEIKPLPTANASCINDKHIEELLETATESDTGFEALPLSYPETFSENVVSFSSSYTNEKIVPLDSEVIDMDILPSINNEEIYGNINQTADADWNRYEQNTTRLSQELAEQLRLVMEPTLASRLQGDYKTGKRINMKKVIPYIASQFRRDKIWLRRTKPNKRDYQVVIAIDDSRSMSESNCRTVAIEALVTVCRAMTQVEVGQFAVSSFGEKGNIKLLHDFDETFTRETGVKIISSLTFKQDNTIADDPVVDLLKYLNSMLDSRAAKARTPSGQNPLHQLILIIADGRFHEKENLRRCVRNLLNAKRMIAFILLDSPQESIVDLMEACFEGQTLTFKKYLNSFPFPFYIVLKNVEALPRTLADLLRQWFELTQSMRG